MTSSAQTQPTYVSVEDPHKPRRNHSFWKIILLTLTILGVALLGGVVEVNSKNHPATAAQSQQSVVVVTRTADPSTGLDNNNAPDSLLLQTTAESYKVDMNKSEWPELVGKDAEIAKKTIQGENPSITKVQILPQDSFVTMDYSTSRVRIFVDDNNKVASTPRIG